jgi:ABC-2 type transport system ATP-binding protein
MQFAVETEHLGRVYRPKRVSKGGGDSGVRVALDDVNLQLPRGELFGLLGPNGAGKTTLIKILTTLLSPSTGSARVAGFDVAREPERVRPRINMVSGGEASGYGLLTVRENLWMFGQFYGLSSADTNRRIAELVEVVNMSDRLNTKSYELSTGLRQKMNIVRGYLSDPDVVFLDEPTLGLDVAASRDVRGFIRRWMDEEPERTTVLTTHYMAEADDLCDRVAIINGGRLLACDTPAALKRRLRQDAIFEIETPPIDAAMAGDLSLLAGVRKAAHRDGDGCATLELILEAEHVIGEVLACLQRQNVQLVKLTKREPTLEDVFVDLVGRSMAEVEGGAASQ